MRRTRRSAYTLLEIILALIIAVMLMASLYSAVGFQLRQAQTGRDIVGQTLLTRSLLARMENDLTSVVALADPGRFRNQRATTQQQPSTTTPPAESTEATESTDQGADSTEGGMPTNTGPVQLPLGVMGDSSTLTLFVTKVPTEVYGIRPGEGGQLVSDIRRISYWLADGGAGLCRQEIRIATAEEALNPALPTGDTASYLMATEVKSVEFRYFDGTGWMDSWDSTALGDDGKTPMGSPRAIEIRLGMVPRGTKAEENSELKTVRHVIFLPTANGITQATGAGSPP